MVNSIGVENFRCFRRSYFEGFGRVNLLGGKNNSGKTAFLEALLLANVPSHGSVNFLQLIRLENINIFRDHPELAWNNLFFKGDKLQKIRFNLGLTGTNIDVTLSCREEPKSIPSLRRPITTLSNEGEELVKVIDSETLTEVGSSTLKLESRGTNFRTEQSVSYHWRRGFSKGGHNFQPNLYTYFVTTGFKRPSIKLAGDFDRAVAQGSKNIVIDGFVSIDETIEDVMTLSLGEPRIHVKRKNDDWRPLNYFGDALNKVADIMLRIANNPNCLLLIDEIENGIHWTNHEKFWSLLFSLAKKFRVQIFATSHSKEMIEAFKNAAIAEKNQDANYFELIKSSRSGEIIAEKLKLEVLEYKIKTNHPFRGE